VSEVGCAAGTAGASFLPRSFAQKLSFFGACGVGAGVGSLLLSTGGIVFPCFVIFSSRYRNIL
jgi:hypothetical protein